MLMPWVPEDGDTKCQACWQPNVAWWTDRDDWNRVMGSEAGILCLACFATRADQENTEVSGVLVFELVLHPLDRYEADPDLGLIDDFDVVE